MSVATYAARGRYAFWVGASANMYLELTDDEGDYLNDALSIAGWGMATGALLVPEIASTVLGWGLTRAAQGSQWMLGSTARALAPVAGTIVTAAAPITAGYVIGATVGTVIAEEVWGEEGAQTALGFYSAGLLPGTEAPDLTDYQYIFKPTAPGGPSSLYDVGKQAVQTSVVLVSRLWDRRPIRYRRERKWYHLI